MQKSQKIFSEEKKKLAEDLLKKNNDHEVSMVIMLIEILYELKQLRKDLQNENK